MARRLLIPLFAGGALLSTGVVSVPGQTTAAATAAQRPAGASSSATQLYLQGMLLRGEAAKLEKEGDPAGAYFKYKEAKGCFDAVYEADPSWQPEMVEYRRRVILEEMERARQAEIRRRKAGGEVSSSGVIGVPKEPTSSTPAPLTPARNSAEVVEERLRGMQARIDELTAKNEQVIKQLGAREEELRALNRQLLESRQKENALRESLMTAKTKIETASISEKRKNQELTKRVAELEGKLEEAMKQLQEANGRADSLLADLENAYVEIRERTRERDELQRERDQLKALLAADGSGKGLNKLKIVEENERMRKELEAAKTKIAQLSGEKERSREEIASLREQLKTVREQLATFEAENESYRQQIAALTSQLDETQARLAQATQEGAAPEPLLAAENGVLREIILQQMKQQAKREAARRNLMEELTREGVLEKMREMGAETEKMLRAVADMAAPLTLTREQRSVLAANGGLDSFLLKGGVGQISVAAPAEEDGNAPPEAAGPVENTPNRLTPSRLSPELRAYATAAEQHFRDGAFAEAENQYRKILMVHPQSTHALKNLAVVQLRLGAYEEAEVNLKKAQAYDYDNDLSHYLLGVVYLRQGRLDEAVEEIEVGLKLNPNYAPAHVTLGMVALRRNQQKEAEQRFKQAIAIDPTSADAHYNLAVIYANAEKLSQAANHYNLAVRHGAPRNSSMEKLLRSGA